MSAAFYNGLRDDTAGPLISQFGLAGVLRQVEKEYSPTTGGMIVGREIDTSIRMLDLPVERGIFEESLEQQMTSMLLVASKELNAASVIAEPGDLVRWTKEGATVQGRILAKKVIGPSGISVIEKWGVTIA